MPGGPVRLDELRVWVAAGARLAGEARNACEVLDSPDRAHLLLVETSAGLTPSELEHLAGEAAAARLPSAIWLTREEDVRELEAGLLERFDRVFVTDATSRKIIAERVGHDVLILPLAARLPAGTPRLRPGIDFLGGFSASWPARSRELAEALLDAALPHDLRIVLPAAAGARDLPERFAAAVAAGEPGEPMATTVIAFVARGGIPTVPGPALDAIAAGSLLMMPSSDAWQILPPRIVQYVTGPELAAEQVRRCVSRTPDQTAFAREARAAVLNAHTYAARLATIASAFGWAVLPRAGTGAVAATPPGPA